MLQTIPKYEIGEHVLYLQDCNKEQEAIVNSIKIDKNGINYELIINDAIRFHGVGELSIKPMSKFQRFVAIDKQYHKGLMTLANPGYHKNSVKFSIMKNKTAIIDILQCLGSADLEISKDYELFIGYNSRHEASTNSVEVVFYEKNEIQNEDPMLIKVSTVGGAIIEEEDGVLSVEVTGKTTTVEDLAKLPIIIPVGAAKNILKGEHLKFMLGKDMDKEVDEAVTLSVIRKMCKERLDYFRSLKS